MSELHFIRPWWLLSLLPLLLLLPIWLKQLRQPQQLSTLVAPHLVAALGAHNKQKSNSTLWLAVACWLIASLAAAGPSWLKVESPTVSLDRGRVILIDASLATRSNDVRPDRFEQLKFKARDLLNTIAEGQTGLVAYAGDAFVVAPLTNDPKNILHMLPALSPEIMPEPGNHPLLGFRQAHQLLSQAGYQQADIFWLTGGINREQMEDITHFLRQQTNSENYRVSIIASGTAEGAPVRTQRGELLRDRQGRLVIPKLYPEYLERISNINRGKYFNATTDDRDIQALINLADRDTHYRHNQQQGGYDSWLDFGPYLALLLLPLLLLLGYSALGYQLKGRPFMLFPALIVLSNWAFFSPPALAQESNLEQNQESLPARIFNNQDQRALNLYQQQQFDAAAAQTDNHMLRGMSHYRQGDFEQAAEQFARLNTPEGHYNRGNSLVKNGQLEEALAAYTEALKQRPHWPQAEQNQALTKQLLEQEQNKEQDKSEQQDNQQNDDEKGDNQESDAGENSENNETNEQPAEEEPSAENEEPSVEDNEPAAQEASAEPEPEEATSNEEEQSMPAAWADLSEEEREELEVLLRQLDEDPANLLKTRLLREAERRRMRRFN